MLEGMGHCLSFSGFGGASVFCFAGGSGGVVRNAIRSRSFGTAPMDGLFLFGRRRSLFVLPQAVSCRRLIPKGFADARLAISRRKANRARQLSGHPLPEVHREEPRDQCYEVGQQPSVEDCAYRHPGGAAAAAGKKSKPGKPAAGQPIQK